MQFWKSLGGIAAFLIPITALGQNYTYTNVIDSTSPLGNFGVGRLNAAGQVSFFAGRDAGGVGVFRQSGLTTTTIADSTGPYVNFATVTDINDAGQVAYSATNATFAGVFRGSGGAATTIADATGWLASFNPHVRINESGVVAFRGTQDGSNPPSHILAGSGANLTTIALGSTGFVTIIVEAPEINDAGVVSFARFSGFSIETSNGAVGGVVDTTTGPIAFFDLDGAPVNNAGHVLLAGTKDAGGKQILFYDGATLSPLVDTADGAYTALSIPQLNNGDDVAFMGTGAGGFSGIFNGPSALLDQVIIEGQPLFGSTVASGGLTLGGINDLGQIVFNYTLADGRTGIAVASLVPEPSASLGLVICGLLAARRRQRA